LAIDSTKVYTKHGDCFDEDALKLAQEGGNPFHFDALEYVRHNEDSREINEIHGGAIIIAGAGMCTGGRVMHHLRHNLWRAQSSVIFVGFASEGTLGREIIEGRPSVSIFGEDIPVRAKIHTINGFSGHAGQKTLLDWLDATGEPEKILLVHGEDRARAALSRQINEGMGLSAHLQAMNEGVDL
jgi:metallo-beta-lactamase family protein